jgi:hypothetical protein
MPIWLWLLVIVGAVIDGGLQALHTPAGVAHGVAVVATLAIGGYVYRWTNDVQERAKTARYAAEVIAASNARRAAEQQRKQTDVVLSLGVMKATLTAFISSPTEETKATYVAAAEAALAAHQAYDPVNGAGAFKALLDKIHS